MTEQRLKTIAVRWIEEGWQKGNADIVDELHSPHFVDHSASGRTSGREGFKQGIRELYAAFPDFHSEINTCVIDAAESQVAVGWTASATHQGCFMGIGPTGKRVRFRGIEIIRIKDGRIIERWGEWNGIELLKQMQATGVSAARQEKWA